MSARPIERGAIGVVTEDVPGNFEGRLWKVSAVFEGGQLYVYALDWDDERERSRPHSIVCQTRFWCLLDAGVVNI